MYILYINTNIYINRLFPNILIFKMANCFNNENYGGMSERYFIKKKCLLCCCLVDRPLRRRECRHAESMCTVSLYIDPGHLTPRRGQTRTPGTGGKCSFTAAVAGIFHDPQPIREQWWRSVFVTLTDRFRFVLAVIVGL